jgi:FAD/FMN-containing dehydrogenase
MSDPPYQPAAPSDGDGARVPGARRPGLSRREFVVRGSQGALLLGGGAGLGWLSGCGTARRGRTDLGQLAREVSGPVVRPGDAAYGQARLLFNPSFDGARPRAVVFCQAPDDVAAVVRFARRRGLALAPRAGGHSFGGYSAPDGAIVADVSRMRHVRVDRSGHSAVLGAGCPLADVYSTLGRRGLAIPGGTCPTVAVGGLTLGGGFGFSSRKLGLTADNLLEVELVTAAGDRLTCSPERHPDLFWACRGGGGGNFGIATSFRLRLHPVTDVAVYELSWRWNDAAVVLEAWQRWAPEAPDELFSTCALARAGGPRPTGPAITSQGQYFGPPGRLAALLEPLLSAARPSHRRVASASFLEAQQLWADCPPERCRERAANPYTVKSDFFAQPLPRAGVTTLIEELERWPGSAASSPTVGVQLNSWGGAIARVPSSATAFVHRDARFLAIYGTTWSRRDDAARVAANRAWLEGFHARMRPFASGFAYQNLIDPRLADWRHAYYGSNLARLVAVKRRYDPEGFFRFAQGIPVRL